MKFAPLAALLAVTASAGSARADITLYDKDGWSFYTKGLIAAHYQLVTGDGEPAGKHGVLVGVPLTPQGAQDPRDNTVQLSRVRSGFIGTQIGFGVNRQVSDAFHIESLMAVSVYDISSNRNQTLPKGVDFREAWAAAVTPYGTFKFGRMFEIFGSAGSEVVLMAFRYGMGHPCALAEASISCGTAGAGPIYPGFDGQFRYISPRVGGLGFQAALSDPWVVSGYHMTKYPRFDAELSFDRNLGPAHVRLLGQGMGEQVQRLDSADPMMKTLKTGNVVGVMGVAMLDISGLQLGGGGWTGNGFGLHGALEDGNNPPSVDSNLDLRLARGFFGNAAFTFSQTTVAAGGGISFLRSTAADIAAGSGLSVIKQAAEFHLTLAHKIDAITLNAEVMRWMSKWYFGEKQDNTFIGVGANYAW